MQPHALHASARALTQVPESFPQDPDHAHHEGSLSSSQTMGSTPSVIFAVASVATLEHCFAGAGSTCEVQHRQSPFAAAAPGSASAAPIDSFRIDSGAQVQDKVQPCSAPLPEGWAHQRLYPCFGARAEGPMMRGSLRCNGHAANAS